MPLFASKIDNPWYSELIVPTWPIIDQAILNVKKVKN